MDDTVLLVFGTFLTVFFLVLSYKNQAKENKVVWLIGMFVYVFFTVLSYLILTYYDVIPQESKINNECEFVQVVSYEYKLENSGVSNAITVVTTSEEEVMIVFGHILPSSGYYYYDNLKRYWVGPFEECPLMVKMDAWERMSLALTISFLICLLIAVSVNYYVDRKRAQTVEEVFNGIERLNK